jgi:C4-dicarboxylate-specific signal transduction histidine kinase
MRQLVQEVVRVLGEGNETGVYEIALAEMMQVLTAKIQPMAGELKVRCEMQVPPGGSLSNHPANVILLILENLIHNALQVTPPGKTVRVQFAENEAGVSVRVIDEGPGFPAHLRQNAFAPCHSTKGGAGIGLAISQQLASHLGARLALPQSTAAGSVLELHLPRALFAVRPIPTALAA